MAKIIEFYIPQSFRKVAKWLPPTERGKVLAFPLAVGKSAGPLLMSAWRNHALLAWSVRL